MTTYDAEDCFCCCENYGRTSRDANYRVEQRQQNPDEAVVTSQPDAFDASVDTPPITAQPM